jgi:hypothetical protein
VFYQQKSVASTKLKFLIKEKHWYEHIKKQNIFERNLKLVKKNCHKNKMDSWVIENFLSSKLLTIKKGCISLHLSLIYQCGWIGN